jgi:hypothetical protein
MPCFWRGGNPYAESEASNAAASGARGVKDCGVLHSEGMNCLV